MVKPPLRTKSIGFKVSEEEHAQLETAAQADGRTLGEWCREVILERSDGSAHRLRGQLLTSRIAGQVAPSANRSQIVPAAATPTS